MRRLLIIVVTAVLAGCGGGAPHVANVGSSTPATTTRQSESGLVAFSSCMRANGVPSFPDPQRFVGGNVKLTIHRLGTGSPKFEAALSACDHLLPGGRQQPTAQTRTQLADELSFARCMRSHGVSRFPDPTGEAGLTIEMVQAQGIDVHAPAVLRAVQECVPASHGALTITKVRDALAHAHG